METVEAELPTNYKDMEALRYAMRTDGKSGFVFINHHQRNFALKNIYGAVIDTGVTQFPPLDIKGDISFFMPFQMPVGCLLYTSGTEETPSGETQGETTAPPPPPTEPVRFSVDFDALKAVNPDNIGWLIMNGTQVNNPVVRGEDNTHYLRYTCLLYTSRCV